jgi:hypothetical protein
MRRWGLAALLAVLVAVGAAWGQTRSAGGPARGAGPASVELALPAGVAQLAVTSRADPRDPAPLTALPPEPAGAIPAAAPAAPVVRSSALAPAAVAGSGGRSPPLPLA